jgi:hypothetical protein
MTATSPNVPTFSLDQIKVASPCSMRWEDMTPVGDGLTVRHCASCSLNVHNLSAMKRGEAEALVVNAQGRLCGAFFRRADGTVLTRDCPVGLRAARARAARLVGRLAAAVGLMLTGGVLAGAKVRGEGTVRLGNLEPFATIRSWLVPAGPRQQQLMILGDICPPPSTGTY